MLEKIVKETNFIDVLIIVIASVAIVSFWRGVWGLLDRYLFPDNRDLSLVASIGIGLLILMLIALYKRDRAK